MKQAEFPIPTTSFCFQKILSKILFNEAGKIFLPFILPLFLTAFSAEAQDTQIPQSPTTLRYVGSSTIANFINDASPAYGKVNFDIDSEPESAGGEQAIMEGRADIAGIARVPSPTALGRGVVSTLIGWDAIAVVVNESNPISNLTQTQLRDIFTGKVRNWKEFGGPDLIIKPYIVSSESATRNIFRSIILEESNYLDCEVVSPDVDILASVKNDPGGIGHISFSFLGTPDGIKAIAVNGQKLVLTNPNYLITRPLYLLWWPGRRDIADFMEWTQTGEGQRIVMKRFIGTREGTVQISDETGTLIVFTETFPVEDGGIFYYPHRAYQILSTDRKFVMNVPNHLGNNDENPTKVELSPGSYLILPETEGKEQQEFFVTIQLGKLTKLNVEDLLKPPVIQKPGLPPVKVGVEDRLAEELKLLDKFKFLKPYGDLRIRGEYDDKPSSNRFRGRFRLRTGMSATINSSSKLELRLVSTGNPDDPNSSHVNLNDGFNQVFIAIDRAFFYVNPQNFKQFRLWLGKFSNPFVNSSVFSELVWDADIQPEGGAFSFTYNNVGKINKITFVNGTYLISQFKTGQEKPWLNTNQLTINFSLSKSSSLTLSSGLYYYANIKGMDISSTVFDSNAGNTTFMDATEVDGDTVMVERFATDFRISDNFVLLKIKSLPKPLTIKVQYINNFGPADNNQGYAFGASYGSLNDKRDWRIYYQYQYIQQDAIFSPFVQDDALRQTNFKGHIFGIAYSLHKKISLHAWGLIDKPINGSSSSQTRLRLDLNVKI